MSATWRLLLRRFPPWQGCCYEHDDAYIAGGSAADRFDADVKLLQCVARESRAWAFVMFVAVRLFGAPWWGTP